MLLGRLIGFYLHDKSCNMSVLHREELDKEGEEKM